MTMNYKFLWCSCGIRLRAATDDVLTRKWEVHLRYGDPAQRHMPDNPQAEEAR